MASCPRGSVCHLRAPARPLALQVVHEGARLHFPAASPPPAWYERLALDCMSPNAADRPTASAICEVLEAAKDA
jgi:hypothetical protein